MVKVYVGDRQICLDEWNEIESLINGYTAELLDVIVNYTSGKTVTLRDIVLVAHLGSGKFRVYDWADSIPLDTYRVEDGKLVQIIDEIRIIASVDQQEATSPSPHFSENYTPAIGG